jgi:type VI secretion system protein
MALKLRVISDQYKALGKRSSRLFGVTGGRIGRAQDNDWILPDPDRYVSSHHCKVSFRSGQWLLEDTSTNGVFINGADTPVSVDGAYPLKDGDRLRVGDYEIIVSIDERNDFSADASGQMPAPAISRARAGENEVPVMNFSDDLGEELDITDLLSDASIAKSENSFEWIDDTPSPDAPQTVLYNSPKPQAAAAPPAPAVPVLSIADTPPPQPTAAAVKAAEVAVNRSNQSALNSMLDGLSASEVAPGAAPNPKNDKDWDMQTRPYNRKTMSLLPPTTPVGKVAEERPRRSTDFNTDATSAAVEAFCRGAGIDPSTLPADTQTALLTLAGQMLRECVLGLMEALKGRADLKNKLRLSQTMIQSGENNPLKFSAGVDEAVRKLLDPHGSRYLGPIEAIRESFSDLRTHQSALSSAMQTATDELMNRIEPGELQERFDRGLKRGALLGAANKMKYWDLYTEFFQVLNQRNEQGLPNVFAEELARTYAEKSTPKKR